jgi:glyoxylate/hydroxypyruvate reductase
VSSLKVHVLNDPELSAEQFHVDEGQFWDAVARDDALRADDLSLAVDVLGSGVDVRDADVLVGWAFPPELVAAADHLQLIHVIGAGVDHLQPFDWVPEGVTVANSSGVHAPRAGDFVACALLMLNNLFPHHLTEQRAHRWSPRYSGVIAGRTVVIIGVGAIGGEAARRAKGLGLHVRGVRASGRPHPYVDEVFAPDALHDALSDADFVVVCAALTDETRGMLDAEALARLPERAGIVNIAREPLVDYRALAVALREERLAGAILDVFEPEPLAEDSELWCCPRLIVTPHISSDPIDYTPRMLDLLVENLGRLAQGDALVNVVHPDHKENT